MLKTKGFKKILAVIAASVMIVSFGLTTYAAHDNPAGGQCYNPTTGAPIRLVTDILDCGIHDDCKIHEVIYGNRYYCNSCGFDFHYYTELYYEHVIAIR